jgi:dimethylaniline monooxygenase (N-oxide forming)
MDRMQNLGFVFVQSFMSKRFPNFFNNFFDNAIESISNKSFPNLPKAWNLLPAPSHVITSPLVADEIYPLLRSGFATPVPEVKQITDARTVELVDGTILENIDAIVYCTGYDLSVPFIDKEFDPYPVAGQAPDLYRGIFPLHPDPKVRESLAFLGHAGFFLAGLVTWELVGLAVTQIWKGKSHLPSHGEMKQWHDNWLEWRKDLIRRQKTNVNSLLAMVPFYDQWTWLNQTVGTGILDHFGAFNSKAWSFWWQDRSFYSKCKSGILSPAIFRLFDEGKRKAWSEAKEQIIKDNELSDFQIESRNEMLKRAEQKLSFD